MATFQRCEAKKLTRVGSLREMKKTTHVTHEPGRSVRQLSERHRAKANEIGMAVEVRYDYSIDERANRRVALNLESLGDWGAKAQ
jgi:hypothetical protein